MASAQVGALAASGMLMKTLLGRLTGQTSKPVSTRPDNRLRDQGDAARNTGDLATAAVLYEQHLAQQPDDFAIWVQFGHALKQGGKLDRAETAYARAAGLRADDGDLLLSQGHLAKMQGRLDLAADFYRRSHAVDGNPDAAREIVTPDMLIQLAQSDTAASAIRIVGNIDGVAAGHLVGWAVDPDHPDRPALVEIVVDGVVIATEYADIFRDDVIQAGLATGPSGFRIRISDLVQVGEGIDAHVRLKHGGTPLVGSPHAIRPSAAAREWLTRHDHLDAEDLAALSVRMTNETLGQTLSIVMPVYNTPAAWLREAIDSVRAQWCPHWQLICVDDASPQPHVAAMLRDYAAAEPRIVVVTLAENGGISRATNAGIRAATGEYAALMDHDDFLEPEAVYRLLDAARTGAGLIYSDEIVTGEDINRIEHFVARPAFSHAYYLSHPYFVHVVCVRRDIAIETGGFDEAMTISADVDFVLRVIERAQAVVHVPAMLYRWRTHDSSTGHARMDDVMTATLGAQNRHLQRMGLDAVAVEGPCFNVFRTDHRDPGGRTLVVIPTRDGLSVLKPCIESLLTTTSRDDVDIVIVDHQSEKPETLAYFREIADRVRIIGYTGKFNFSRINNDAVRRCLDGHAFVVFLNNDIEAIEPGWLEHMRGLCARDDVGVVGATLLYPNGSVQHAGVLIGHSDAAEHGHKFAPFQSGNDRRPGYNASLVSTRDYSAVTAACMMMRADVFQGVGGFDESFAIGYNDTDLCLRVAGLGYRVLNDAHAVLHHHESMTRAQTRQVDHPEDKHRFRDRWAAMIATGDPFYSPLLSLTEDHALTRIDNLAFPVRIRQTRPVSAPLENGRHRLVPGVGQTVTGPRGS